MNIKGNKISRWPITMVLLLTLAVGSGMLGPLIPPAISNIQAALKGDSLVGKVVNPNGKPVPGAQVQLLSPASVMMDVTTTGADGKFTLDLGVLEEEEMAKLESFRIAISINGRNTEKILSSGASSANGVVKVDNIELK